MSSGSLLSLFDTDASVTPVSPKESAGGSIFATRSLRPGDPLVGAVSEIIEATCCSILDLDNILISEKVCIARYQMETFHSSNF